MRTLGIAGALGAAIALAIAFALPDSGVGGTTTGPPTTTQPAPTCNGEAADVIMEEPGTYVATGQPEVIVGSFGDDTIRGTKGNDSICGRDGDDQINAGQGNDELRGQDGEDLLRGRKGQDDMVGGFDENSGKGSGGGEDDRCFGGDPVPDTGPKGDTASQCEDVKSARIIDIEN